MTISTILKKANVTSYLLIRLNSDSLIDILLLLPSNMKSRLPSPSAKYSGAASHASVKAKNTVIL
jgi:hypothetical protein